MIKYLNKYLFFVVLALSGVNLINAQTDALGETLVGLLKSDGAWPPTFKFTTGYSAADYQGDVVVDGTTHSIGSGRVDVTIPKITPSSNLTTLVSTFNVEAYRVDLFNANNTQLGSIALSDIGAGGTTTINIAKVSAKTDYKVKAQLWIKRVGVTDYEYVFNDDNLYSLTLWPEPSVTTPSIEVRQLTDDKSYEFNQTATTTGGYNQGWSYDWKLNTTSIGNEATCSYKLDVDVAETQLGPSIFTFKVDAVNYAPDGTTVWFKYTADNVAQVKMYDAPKAPTSLTQYKTSDSATTVYNIADGIGLTDAQLTTLGYTLEFDDTASASHQYVGPAATTVKAVRTYSDGFTASSAEVPVGIISTASSKIIPVLTAGTAAYGEGYGPVNTEDNSYGWVGSSLTFSETPRAAFNRTNNVTITAKKASFGGSTHNVDVPFDNLTKGNNTEVRVLFGATIATADGDSYSFDFDMTQKHGVYIYDTPVKPTTALSKTKSPDNVRLGNTLTATIADNTGNPDGWEYKWMSSFLFNEKELATEATYADNTIYAIDGTGKRTEPVHYTLVCTNKAPDGTVWYSTTVDAGKTMIYNVPAKPGKLAHYQYTYNGEEQNLYVAHNTGANDATDDYEYVFNGIITNTPTLFSTVGINEVYAQFIYPDGYVTQSTATQISASDHYSPAINLSVNGINLTDESGLDGFTYAGAVIDNQSYRAHTLVGSEVEFNASATMANTAIKSSDVINKATRTSVSSGLNLTAPGSSEYIVTFDGTITVDGNLTYDIQFDGTQEYTINGYAKPTAPTAAVTGRLQISDIATSDVTMTADAPTNGAGNWTQQWNINDQKIDGATATSYTDKTKREIDSPKKQIDQYNFSVTFEDRINPDDSQPWLSYTLPVTTLKVYNVPNSVGRFDVYDLKSVNGVANKHYFVTPANIGLTNEQLKDYGYQIIFDDAILESEFLGNGRSIYDLDIPSFIRTRFIYDDGFETYSPVNNTPNIITVTTSANPSLSHAALQQAAEGYTIGDPVTVDGTHYGMAGATLTVKPTAKFDNLTGFTCDAKVDGNDIAGYVATEGQKTISTTYRATIQVESNQTESFSFEGTNDNSVYIHPAPTIPTITFGLDVTSRDVDSIDLNLRCSTPAGANPSAWSVQWLNNGTEIEGATDTKYSYNYSKDVKGNAKNTETDVYSMRYINLAPDGLTEWVKGTVENVGSITFYNTPNAVYSLDLVKIGDQTEAYAAGLGLTDDELRNLEYEFVFNDNIDAPQRSRKFEGDNAQSVYSRWTYDDGFVSNNKGLAAGVRTLTFDWGTNSLEVVSDTETDQRYKGNVKDAENNKWYGLIGIDTAKLTASYTFDKFDTINAELTAKTIINKDGQEAASLDFTGNVDYPLGKVGTYDMLNHAEIVYYAESNQSYKHELDQAYVGSVVILPYPTIEDDIAAFSGKKYDDIDTINFIENFSNAGANSEGWAFDCYVDNNSGCNGKQTFAIDSDKPQKDTHKVKIAYSNTAPVGETKWFEGETQEVPFYVYNTPDHQPTAIGHFTDNETKQDFYFAMGTGLDDTALNNCGYKFIGSYCDDNYVYYNIIYDNDKRVFSTSSGVPTGVSAVWIYSDDKNDVEYISPADNNRKYCTTINEYAFNYGVSTELTLGEGHTKDNGYLETNIEDANKNLHGFVNDAITSTFSVKLNESVATLTQNSKIVLTKDNKTLSSYDFGKTPSTPNAAGTYAWAMEVETLLPVETEVTQTISLTGHYTEPVKFTLWSEPTIETPSVESFTVTDYEVPTLNLEAKAAEGATESWSQQWYRNDVKHDDKTELKLEKDEVLDDPSLVMNTTDYSYAMEYTNTAPDGETEWFKKKVDIGVVTVYNAPASPGALVHYVDSTTPANNRWIAANVGLSDEQIDARKYSFEFSDGTNTIDIDSTRYLEDKDTPEFTSVKSVWKYSDTMWVYGKKAASIKDDIFAFPKLQTDINVTEGDNEGDTYYHGSVRDEKTIYALAGSDVKITISTEAPMTMDDVKLSGIGDITDMTIAEGSKTASASMRINEAGTYKLGIDMSVQGVIDSYLDKEGNTAYEYANLGATATWSCPAQIIILPKPVYPKADMQYLQYRDIDTPNTTFTVTNAENGNGKWDYAWYVNGILPEVASKDTSYKAIFNAIDNSIKDTETYTYTLQFADKNPVNDEKNPYWIYGEIPVGEIRVYNTPKAPDAIMVYDGGNDNTYSIAYGMGITNTELSERGYKFRFDSTDSDNRYVKGNASSVKSLWQYEAEENYPAFDCYSNAVTTRIKDKAVISGEVNIGNVEVEGYAGATQDEKDDLRWYALEGSAADYEFNVQSDNTRNGLNLKVKTSDFSLNDNKIDGSTSNMKWSTSYNKANVYNGVVNGTLVATVDPSMGSDNTIDLPFQLDIPSNTIVEVMATPTLPKKNENYPRQYRDIDILNPQFGTSIGQGANDKDWRYHWTFNGKEKYADEKEPGTLNYTPTIEGDAMATETHTFTLNWENVAPNGESWITGTIDYPITIYNTPEAPAALTRKGNGTSNIYVATGMAYDGQAMNDETLTRLGYNFVFGDGDDNDSADNDSVHRWYKFQQTPANPWVRALWTYDDGYRCVSDPVSLSTDGAYSERGESDMDLIQAMYGDDVTVYTTAGVPVHQASTERLQPGVYIIRYGTGDDARSEKIVIR